MVNIVCTRVATFYWVDALSCSEFGCTPRVIITITARIVVYQ